MKKLYVTKKNIRVKGREWLELLSPYHRRKYFEIDLSKSALMVIDMQHYFCDDSSHASLPAAQAIIPNIRKLVSSYRANGYPVVFTRHAHRKGEDPGIMGKWWSDLMWEGSIDSRIIPEFEPSDEEIVVRKSRYSAFQGTDLEHTLPERNVESLVITGVMTHLCCESTAREAFMKDFLVYFVVDATASQCEELHVSSLITLSDGFAIPVTTDELLSKIGG
jgi:isochorismate hydrolase